jgi:transposase-like protein
MLQTDLNSFSYKKGTVVPWCKRCGVARLVRDGHADGKQRMKCKTCGYRFVWTSDLPKRQVFSEVITFATELYTTVGISLREIARKLARYLGVCVTYEAVRKWVLACRALHFPRIQPDNTPVWHIDEVYIKIKGIKHCVWVVSCHETRAVLAWHASKFHSYYDCLTVLRQALANTGVRPAEIITDGLWQYQAAIRKVFGWKYVKHTIDSGVGKNARIERINKEIKRRTKWFSTFQSLDGLKAFFNLFFYHYNHTKPNRMIGMTPAQKARTKTPNFKQLLWCFPTPDS